jgi:hypothetical protein
VDKEQGGQAMNDQSDLSPSLNAQTRLAPGLAEFWERACRRQAYIEHLLAQTKEQMNRTQRRLAISYGLLDHCRWPLRWPGRQRA